MGRVRDMLRSGDWLTPERVRLVAATLLIASAAGFAFLVASAHGGVDRQGRPLGTDFSNVYAAGTYVLDGRPEVPFDPPQQYAREQAIFGPATPFYGWHYPPYFLFVAGALARMPYGLALAVWQATTLGLYLLAIWAIAAPFRGRGKGPGEAARESWFRDAWFRDSWFFGRNGRPAALRALRIAPPGAGDVLLLALAFPAVLINIGHGQNGFLTAALLGGALVVLDCRPVLAGILFGLLIYKPQYGLMIPIVLAASGRWRSFAAAAATVALLTIVTTAAFGLRVWPAFLTSTEFSRTVVLEQGDTGWYKIQSVFSWARMWGAPIPLAYGLQGAVTVALAVALVRLWRSMAPSAVKAAALCLAAILATPYSLDYDMMVLAPAMAFLAAAGRTRGFLPWEKTGLAGLWLVPLLSRTVAHATLIPLGVPAMLAAFVLTVRRAELDRDVPAPLAGASSPVPPATGAAGAGLGHDIAAFE